MKFIITTGESKTFVDKKNFSCGLGNILQKNGYKVSFLKIDPYINYNTGMMDPNEEGEVFVLNDGSEVSVDLGVCERTCNLSLTKNNYLTIGNIIDSIIETERNGAFNTRALHLGEAFYNSFISHLINLIETPAVEYVSGKNFSTFTPDIFIIDIGKIVSDPDLGFVVRAIAKFTESIVERSDLLVFNFFDEDRNREAKPQSIVDKIWERDFKCDIYQFIARQAYTQFEMVRCLQNEGIPVRETLLDKKDFEFTDFCKILSDINLYAILKNVLNLANEARDAMMGIEVCGESTTPPVVIGIISEGQRSNNPYCSVEEALISAGRQVDKPVKIMYIDAERLGNGDEHCRSNLEEVDAILIPGGFGTGGLVGKIEAARYARVNNVPFLGICLGFQIALIEFARNVLSISEANSQEFDPNTPNPIIQKMKRVLCPNTGKKTLLGAFIVKYRGEAAFIHGKDSTVQRFRHRYAFKPEYRNIMEASGIEFMGKASNDRLVLFKYKRNGFYAGVQYHPELKSRYDAVDPIIKVFVQNIYKK
ncbi:CTP synthase [Enteropsectra breve]|nr:CTP synthase [Enteropsectra breve]